MAQIIMILFGTMDLIHTLILIPKQAWEVGRFGIETKAVLAHIRTI